MDGAGRAGLDGSALAQAILEDAGADTRVDMDGTKILRQPCRQTVPPRSCTRGAGDPGAISTR